MSTPPLAVHPSRETTLGRKAGLFLIFVVLDGSAFIVIPAVSRQLSFESASRWQAFITGFLLVIALLASRQTWSKLYAPVIFACFVAALAVLVSLLFGDDLRVQLGYFLIEGLGFRITGSAGIALSKLSQALLRIVPILILIPLSGGSWRSLYLQRGRLLLGIGMGLLLFFMFAVLAFLPFKERDRLFVDLLTLSPFILLFIFANAFEEELLFRGLFLKRLEPFLGQGFSNLLTAIVFTLAHLQVTYSSDLFQFLAILFPLSLAFGYLIQKTDGLWGSILFHAGADLLIITGIFVNLSY